MKFESAVSSICSDFCHSAAWQVLEERSRPQGAAESSGLVKARYVWSVTSLGGYVDSLILRDADLNNDRGVR